MGFIENLKSLKIQSATTIAVESLKYLRAFSAKHGFGKKFGGECQRLLKARPTGVVLYNAIQMAKREKTVAGINKIIRELDHAKSAAAQHASKLFRRRVAVLTHCHSSFVVEALVRNRSRIKHVVVTETRPKDQGLITAKQLLENKIKVYFIVDSAISDFIEGVDFVMVGADALRKEGLVNKVGTHTLALVAKENRKPFYVLASSFALDSRKKLVMEQRPASELNHKGIRGAKIFNPAFDITPWKYVTAMVTEKGVAKPASLKKIIR